MDMNQLHFQLQTTGMCNSQPRCRRQLQMIQCCVGLNPREVLQGLKRSGGYHRVPHATAQAYGHKDTPHPDHAESHTRSQQRIARNKQSQTCPPSSKPTGGLRGTHPRPETSKDIAPRPRHPPAPRKPMHTRTRTHTEAQRHPCEHVRAQKHTEHYAATVPAAAHADAGENGRTHAPSRGPTAGPHRASSKELVSRHREPNKDGRPLGRRPRFVQAVLRRPAAQALSTVPRRCPARHSP